MTDAQRAAQQEKEALAAIESGSIRRNSAPDPETVVAPPPPSEVIGFQESQAAAKFRAELLATKMSAQEAEDLVAEMEGRAPRVMPAAKTVEPPEVGLADKWERAVVAIASAPTPVDPVEMSDEEWAAARRRVTDARARVSSAQDAVTAATAELDAAIGELEAAKRDVAAGAAFLTSL